MASAAADALQESKRAQIFARLVEAATAKRGHKFSTRFDPVGRNFPFAPGKQYVVERKRFRIFVFEHGRDLAFIPTVLGRKHAGAEHVKKSVHFRVHFAAKLPDRMMQTRGEFNTNVMLCRADKSSRDLCRSGKSLGGH